MVDQQVAEGSYEEALADLGTRLTRLKAQRGRPPLRKIEARAKELFGETTSLPLGTQSAAFNGKHVSIDTLILIVRTLLSWDEYGEECLPPDRRAPELDEWRTRWTAATALQSRRRSTALLTPVSSERPDQDAVMDRERPEGDPTPAPPLRLRDKYGLPIVDGSRAVYCLAFSPDGRCLAAGGADGTMQLWDTATTRGGGDAKPLGTPLTGHLGPVYGVHFSQDGRYLATGGADGSVCLWDTYSREPVGDPLTGHDGAVHAVRFRGNGSQVVAAGADGTVRQWLTYSLKPYGTPLDGLGTPVIALATPGSGLAAGDANGLVKWWAQDSDKPTRFLAGHGPVFAMADQAFALAVGHASGAVYVRDTSQADAAHVMTLSPPGSAVYAVAMLPGSSRLVAAGSHDGTLRVWAQEGDTGPFVAELHEGPIFAVAFSPDGTFVATAGADGDVQLRNFTVELLGKAPHGRRAFALPTAARPTIPRTPAPAADDHPQPEEPLATSAVHYALRHGHPVALPPLHCPHSVRAVVFSPDGRLLATGAEDGSVQLWDPRTREPVGARLTQRGGMARSLVFSPDSRLLAAVHTGRPVQLWDTATHELVGELPAPTGSIRSAAFSHDGKVLATGGTDSAVRLWDPATQEAVRGPLIGHGSPIESLAISPGGLLVAVERGNRAWMWDMAAWELTPADDSLQPLLSAGPSVTAMALSPDGRVLALGGLMEGVRLCNLQTRHRTWTMIHGSHVPKVLAPKALAFSPDQKWLAVGGEERSVWLLRTDGGDGVGAELTGHCDTVRALAFSPDSSLVATACDDRRVRLWTVPHRRKPEPDAMPTS
ncbi:WD40 repeat domain-containing protein [Streptomyces sp. NRRL S-1448]|uniref:WD40 repeat domain-containing protein n=1 Tax=Streptomyces sp. NRRL S-1448 TaxID=1463883 RepID=UPI0004C29938|nr:WD40 repeat domain-containing protein [Streptomyces sp. NRRL S-1448]